MVARGDGSSLAVSEMNGLHAPSMGDHEGPPIRTPSSLAPTGMDGLLVRLMCITADLSAFIRCPSIVTLSKA